MGLLICNRQLDHGPYKFGSDNSQTNRHGASDPGRVLFGESVQQQITSVCSNKGPDSNKCKERSHHLDQGSQIHRPHASFTFETTTIEYFISCLRRIAAALDSTT